jgi:heptaprenyl diphosphate synthase
MKTKEIALVGALSAIALSIFMLEAQLPPVVPLPGVSWALANVITLVTTAVLGRRDALLVLSVRVCMGSLFAGNMSPTSSQPCGGLLAWCVMAITVGAIPGSCSGW